MPGVGWYNGNTCAAHSPSLTSNFAHALEGGPYQGQRPAILYREHRLDIFLRLRRRKSYISQLATRHSAANKPERSRRAPKKIVSPVDSWVSRRRKKSSYKTTCLGTLLRVSFMPRQQDHDAFDLEFICEEMPYWGSLTHARSARFGFCCHANSLSETAVGPAGMSRH